MRWMKKKMTQRNMIKMKRKRDNIMRMMMEHRRKLRRKLIEMMKIYKKKKTGKTERKKEIE